MDNNRISNIIIRLSTKSLKTIPEVQVAGSRKGNFYLNKGYPLRSCHQLYGGFRSIHFLTVGRLLEKVIFNVGGARFISSSSSIVPTKVYINADKDKELIVSENKGRTGIYRWVHIESGKTYIGSASNLSARFKQYFNYNHISYPKRNLRIYKALLKYGYSEFRLEILEYCDISVLLQREQFYFDKLNPEYNILKIAGSPLGYKHSSEAKNLIGLASKGRKVSDETREIKRNISLGKELELEHIEKLRLSSPFNKPLLVKNNETGEILEFSSLTEAGKYLGITRSTVKVNLLKGVPYKNYTLSLVDNTDGSVIDEKPLAKNYQQPVLLFNPDTKDKKEFSSINEAAKYLNVSGARMWYFFNTSAKQGNETFKGYIITKLDKEVVANRVSKKIEITDLETQLKK